MVNATSPPMTQTSTRQISTSQTTQGARPSSPFSSPFLFPPPWHFCSTEPPPIFPLEQTRRTVDANGLLPFCPTPVQLCLRQRGNELLHPLPLKSIPIWPLQMNQAEPFAHANNRRGFFYGVPVPVVPSPSFHSTVYSMTKKNVLEFRPRLCALRLVSSSPASKRTLPPLNATNTGLFCVLTHRKYETLVVTALLPTDLFTPDAMPTHSQFESVGCGKVRRGAPMCMCSFSPSFCRDMCLWFCVVCLSQTAPTNCASYIVS